MLAAFLERFSPLTLVPQSREEGGGIVFQAAKFIRISVCVCVCVCVWERERHSQRHRELASKDGGGESG